MIKVKMDTKQLNKILNNSVSYSFGFLEGSEINQIQFNKEFGEFIKETLYKYIDSKARMSPETLHHIYEWDQVGSSSGRLFDFNVKASKRIITFTGKFLQSKSINQGSNEPFSDKARIMENKISITIEPKNASVLVFENEGETIFTSKTIEISNPGGAGVAGSFSSTVDSFFNNYLTAGILKGAGIFDSLKTPKEYSDNFSRGTKDGRNSGIRAGKKYMSLPNGVVIE